MLQTSGEAPAVTAEPAVAAAVEDWRDWLAHERRASPHTRAAYGRDLARFLSFLTGHLGFPPGLQDLEGLTQADFRGFLARRRADGLSSASLARAIASLRGFFRFLERAGLVRNTAITGVRTPKVPHSIPKALSAEEALEAVDAAAEISPVPWIALRDVAMTARIPGASTATGFSQKICTPASTAASSTTNFSSSDNLASYSTVSWSSITDPASNAAMCAVSVALRGFTVPDSVRNSARRTRSCKRICARRKKPNSCSRMHSTPSPR
ncbi:MAG: site-specific integrase [Proteobacteria bacterium]|nr:site-specific integrase [Pseudomonadota bacterium]